ncbi:alpha/beta hydrolase [Litchfieldia alkalitelluris]|uniref:alpha/beta hydrolase n=1 Tax=Litchfieldia alkalitelluris TaxID=304268 RepID=UPI0009961690|nr:alpha/beta hydrolase-fold protein [Litchfieldia alkalitelluris]
MKNKGIMKELTVKSNFLHEHIDLIVYLPSNFTPLYKYQLLIAQDGQDYFNFGKIASVVEDLLEKEVINPTIIIGIPYQDTYDRKNKYHIDGDKHNEYIRFLGEELVPFLDKEFPTFQVGSSRILIGDSLGATVSLLSALSYPNSFGKIILQSPFVNDKIIEKIRDFKESYLIEIHHTIGKNEENVLTTDQKVIDFLSSNRALQQALKEKTFRTTYSEDNGNHTWTYWQSELPELLRKTLSI